MSFVGLPTEAMRTLHSLPSYKVFLPTGIDADTWQRLRDRHLVRESGCGWVLTQNARSLRAADRRLSEFSGQAARA